MGQAASGMASGIQWNGMNKDKQHPIYADAVDFRGKRLGGGYNAKLQTHLLFNCMPAIEALEVRGTHEETDSDRRDLTSWLQQRKLDRGSREHGRRAQRFLQRRNHGGVERRKHGDVEWRNYGGIEWRNYGGVEWRNYRDLEWWSHGDVERRNHGSLQWRHYGDVERWNHGSLQRRNHGDVEWRNYRDLEWWSHGDVERRIDDCFDGRKLGRGRGYRGWRR
jgi:hypothetical protein